MMPPKVIQLLLIAIFSISLSSCGFRPLYATHNENNQPNNNISKQLSEIDIEPISSIEGVEFYNHLTGLLHHNTNSKYLLKTQLSYDSTKSVIQKNTEILRETESLQTRYSLIDKETGTILKSGVFTKISSYSTAFTPYGNSVQERTVRENLARMAAEDVRNRLILFFNKS